MRGCMTNYTGKALIRCQRAGSLPAPDGDAGGANLTGDGAGVGAGACEAGRAYAAAPARRPLVSYEDIAEAAFGSPGRAFITYVM